MTAMDSSRYCVNVCNGNWLQILPVDGGSSLRIFPNPCPNSCDAACPPDVPLAPGGHTYDWDGQVWGGFGSDVCGAEVWCEGPVCMPPGQYVARMCAAKQTADGATSCGFGGTPTCVDVPFVCPPSTITVVEGVIR